jgi:hypothetical protein
MKLTVVRSCLGLAAVLALAIGLSARPAHATNIGTLAVGTSYADTIKSAGPTFARDYDFHLDGTATGVSLLATGLGQTSPSFGIDSMTIQLFNSANSLITSASGAPIAFFDSFAKTGIALGAGDYLLKVFGDVTAGKQAFVSVSLAANNVAATPIPASGLMLLTGIGALGVAGFRRRRSRSAEPPSLAA